MIGPFQEIMRLRSVFIYGKLLLDFDGVHHMRWPPLEGGILDLSGDF